MTCSNCGTNIRSLRFGGVSDFLIAPVLYLSICLVLSQKFGLVLTQVLAVTSTVAIGFVIDVLMPTEKIAETDET